MSGGYFGPQLAQLDMPNDGSARLVSVNVEEHDDGSKTWTVKFKSKPPHQYPCGTSEPGRSGSSPTQPQSHGRGPQVPLPLLNVGLPPLAACSSQIIETEGAQSPLSQRPHMDRLLALKCQVKTYAWGKLGAESLVARIAADGPEELEVVEGTPYAELWMGTHPSGPSMIMLTSPWKMVTPLSEWIKLNPYLKGPRPRPAEGQPRVQRSRSMIKLDQSSVPFLFKILSVRTALSIQAHPDKVLAATLHQKHPDHYKDDNHKPEMAVAITPFEALCSFQPAYSILCNCRATPELVAVIGEKTVRAAVCNGCAVDGDGRWRL